jgi:hypothetical protein
MKDQKMTAYKAGIDGLTDEALDCDDIATVQTTPVYSVQGHLRIDGQFFGYRFLDRADAERYLAECRATSDDASLWIDGKP